MHHVMINPWQIELMAWQSRLVALCAHLCSFSGGVTRLSVAQVGLVGRHDASLTASAAAERQQGDTQRTTSRHSDGAFMTPLELL